MYKFEETQKMLNKDVVENLENDPEFRELYDAATAAVEAYEAYRQKHNVPYSVARDLFMKRRAANYAVTAVNAYAASIALQTDVDSRNMEDVRDKQSGINQFIVCLNKE